MGEGDVTVPSVEFLSPDRAFYVIPKGALHVRVLYLMTDTVHFVQNGSKCASPFVIGVYSLSD